MSDSPLELGPFPDDVGFAAAAQHDAADPLGDYADQFVRSDPDLIYLDGNSLGMLPKSTVAGLRTAIEVEWGRDLIRSWGERWWDLAVEIGSDLAPLLGAAADEVVIADSTSVALYKLALGALLSRPDRKTVITDDMNFPTDNYVLGAAARLAGDRRLLTVPSADGVNGPIDAIIDAIDHETALVSLSHVTFRSGYLYDMCRLTKAAHAVGALVLWDVSHSVGVVPIAFEDCEVDLAVGCTYKYLNGGPGSPAFLYVSRLRGGEVDNPISGWWGHREPFAFALDYRAAPSIRRFQTGTMPILSLAPVRHGVELASEAGIDQIRAKSIALTEFFVSEAERVLEPLGFALASPDKSANRGSHISLRHPEAWEIVQAMVEVAKVIPDFREPDNIRFGLAPLYTSFRDVHTAVQRVAAIVESNLHDGFSSERRSVT